MGQWLAMMRASFVPGYSDGLAPDFHRLPVNQTSTTNRSIAQSLDRSMFGLPCDPHRSGAEPQDTLHRRWSIVS